MKINWREKTTAEKAALIATVLLAPAAAVLMVLDLTGVWANTLFKLLIGLGLIADSAAKWEKKHSEATIELGIAALAFVSFVTGWWM